MATGLTIAAIIIILAATWWLGVWNNVITFVNTVFSTIIASNFFEPMANALDGGTSSYTYLLDFVCLWLLFFISFIILRLGTDLLSRHRMTVNKIVDYAGRTVFSLATAWVFVCFMQFSFHTAPFPIGEGNFQEAPNTSNFVGSPDRLWMGFLQSRSQGAMSASLDALLMPTYEPSLLHEDDKDLDCRVFDSDGDFIYKYHNRRRVFADQDAMRVSR